MGMEEFAEMIQSYRLTSTPEKSTRIPSGICQPPPASASRLDDASVDPPSSQIEGPLHFTPPRVTAASSPDAHRQALCAGNLNPSDASDSYPSVLTEDAYSTPSSIESGVKFDGTQQDGSLLERARAKYASALSSSWYKPRPQKGKIRKTARRRQVDFSSSGTGATNGSNVLAMGPVGDVNAHMVSVDTGNDQVGALDSDMFNGNGSVTPQLNNIESERGSERAKETNRHITGAAVNKQKQKRKSLSVSVDDSVDEGPMGILSMSCPPTSDRIGHERERVSSQVAKERQSSKGRKLLKVVSTDTKLEKVSSAPLCHAICKATNRVRGKTSGTELKTYSSKKRKLRETCLEVENGTPLSTVASDAVTDVSLREGNESCETLKEIKSSIMNADTSATEKPTNDVCEFGTGEVQGFVQSKDKLAEHGVATGMESQNAVILEKLQASPKASRKVKKKQKSHYFKDGASLKKQTVLATGLHGIVSVKQPAGNLIEPVPLIKQPKGSKTFQRTKRSSYFKVDKVPLGQREIINKDWVPPVSVHALIQEELYHDPWKVLIACMLLNKTSGTQMRRVIWDLFNICPTPEAAVEMETQRIEQVIQPLGLQKKRALMIQRFSRDFLGKDWTNVAELHGIGKYATDAYAIFCEGRWREVKPEDHKLVDYWKYLCETDGLGYGFQDNRVRVNDQVETTKS